MFGELKQFTKHLHKTSFNILDFFAKNRTSKLQTELGEEGRMVLFRSNHFASQKRTSHTAKSDLFQLHKLQPPCYFSTYLSIFFKQGELKLDASSRPTRIASVCLRLILHCTIVHTSVVRHSVYSRFGQIQTPLCQGSASPRWGEGAAGHAGTCDTNGQRYVDGQSYFS